MTHALLAGAADVTLAATAAKAGLAELAIGKAEPLARGIAFGSAGACERVIGASRSEPGPGDRRNPGIVSLRDAGRHLVSPPARDGARYRDQAGDVARVAASAASLVKNRLLLHDADSIVAAARSTPLF